MGYLESRPISVEMAFLTVLVLSVYGTVAVTSRGQIFISNEQRIIDHIFNEFHDPFVRPIKRREDQIVVHVGVTYHQLIDVNEKDQIITSSVWIRQNWTNELMTWTKAQYGNISTVNIDPSNVWKPDLYLYNNADEGSDGSQHSFNTKVKISNNGESLWLAPAIIKTPCKINVEYFPFDEQFCDVKLGSWTYDTHRLDVQLEQNEADTSKFVNNGEWDLISMKGKRNEFYYPCCKEPYADLTYTIRIRRRTRFYYINLIIPCFVITGLSILAFKVPPDSGERITLVITNLLSMIVFLLLVADILPPISDATPLISIYYACVMFEIGFALICTCIVLKINFKHPSHGDMPEWFRDLVLHRMAKLFRMTPQVDMAESQKKHFNKVKRKTSIFTAWIPRFSVTRLYSHRESATAGEGSLSPRRRRSLRSVSKSDEPEKNVENQGEPISTEQEEKYIALTEITAQGKDSLVEVEEGSAVHTYMAHEENEGLPGTNEAQGIEKTPPPDVFDDSLPDSEHHEKLKKKKKYVRASSASSGLGSERKCLACSDKSAIHILVHQQENLVKHVESLADMARDVEEEEIKKEEWKLSATVLDEFFFWLYLLMVIVSHAVVFSSIPNYGD